MFTPSKKANKFFRPYREQMEDSENFQHQFSFNSNNSGRSPNYKYVQRNPSAQSPNKYTHNDSFYEHETYHKRNKT